MSEDQEIGYCKPPILTRFKPGQSGNPKGRPKNRSKSIPYDAVLGQMVTLREGGIERRVTAAEAFLAQLKQKATTGDAVAIELALEAIQNAKANGADAASAQDLIVQFVGASLDLVLDKLRIAKLKYATDETRARWALNPWVVNAALARFGDKRLTLAEQQVVWDNTRTPHKVAWPQWWVVGAKR